MERNIGKPHLLRYIFSGLNFLSMFKLKMLDITSQICQTVIAKYGLSQKSETFTRCLCHKYSKYLGVKQLYNVFDYNVVHLTKF